MNKVKILRQWTILLLLSSPLRANEWDLRGLAQQTGAGNEALIVNVVHDLPGGRSNVIHLTSVVTHPKYQFNITALENGYGTASQVQSSLEKLAAKVPSGGTLLFYFGGHGGNQVLWVYDRLLRTREIRNAIEKGRKGLGPLARVVLIFDACESGSNIGPLLRGKPLDAESIAEEMMEGERAQQAWDKLIVMTSSQANELSWVNSNGHLFTTSLHAAFPISLDKNETIGEFFLRINRGLTASHPTYKVVPEDLKNERMAP